MRSVPTHRPASVPQASRHQEYDRRQRDPDAKRFYNSTAWRECRALKLRANPACEVCYRDRRAVVRATHVHHVEELSEVPDKALDLSNLQALCGPCHSRLHARQRGKS
jgi:5-methylcytosine-specific restriction endonuclease McrA